MGTARPHEEAHGMGNIHEKLQSVSLGTWIVARKRMLEYDDYLVRCMWKMLLMSNDYVI